MSEELLKYEKIFQVYLKGYFVGYLLVYSYEPHKHVLFAENWCFNRYGRKNEEVYDNNGNFIGIDEYWRIQDTYLKIEDETKVLDRVVDERIYYPHGIKLTKI